MKSNALSQPRKPGLFWFALLNGLFVLFAILVGLLLIRQLEQNGLEAVDAKLQTAAPWLLGLRLTLMAAFIGFWPQWVAFLAKRRAWEQVRITFMTGLRWRVAIWLAVVELVLVQNGYAAASRRLLD